MVKVTVIGTLNWDITLFVKNIPSPGEEVVVKKIERVPGGKGGNIAVATARILGKGSTELVASLGSDDTGRRQIEILEKEGVGTSGIKRLDHAESGQAYVSVDQGGDDTIMTYFGANAQLSEEHIMSPMIQSILASTSVIVATNPPKQAAHRILAEGVRLGKTVIWHPGVLTRYGLEEWRKSVRGVEYLVLNEHEALALAGARTVEESFETFHGNIPGTKIVVTLGKHGAEFRDDKIILKTGPVDLGKLGLKVVNTTGCGDAFVGAFAAYKALGMKDRDTLAYANVAGALKASKPETRCSPTRAELEDAYESYIRQN